MLPGNYEGKSVCLRGPSFRDIVIEQSVRCRGVAWSAAVHFPQVMKPSCLGSGDVASCLQQGWDWTDEGRSGRHKWGYVSWSPGARLVLQVNACYGCKLGREQCSVLALLVVKVDVTHCTLAR